MKFKGFAIAAAAAATALTPVMAAERSAAPVKGEQELAGRGMIIGLLAAAAIVAGIIIIADDDDDEPVSV